MDIMEDTMEIIIIHTQDIQVITDNTVIHTLMDTSHHTMAITVITIIQVIIEEFLITTVLQTIIKEPTGTPDTKLQHFF